MQDQLSTEQIASYQKHGFLVIEGFLSPDELRQWRVVTQEAVDKRLAEAGAPTSDAEAYYRQVFTQCLKLADTYAGMRSLMHDSRLGAAAGTLAGVDGIRIWHDQALFKPPFGNPTSWHLDNPFWSFSSRDAISVWVALDDATKDNGCLYYLPGTHKAARYDNVGIGQNLADLFIVYPEWKALDSIAAPCPAGSAVFHNGLTAHGAGANMTCWPRRAMTCAYMPDGATFNGVRNVLPEAYFQSLQIGDALHDDAVNPLIWRKGRD